MRWKSLLIILFNYVGTYTKNGATILYILQMVRELRKNRWVPNCENWPYTLTYTFCQCSDGSNVVIKHGNKLVPNKPI